MNTNKFLLICPVIVMLFTFSIRGQERQNIGSKESFSEWNFGIAYIPDGNDLSDVNIWPGTSFLWGTTVISENNFIFEYSAGLAFPSIVTGKIGIGKRFNTTNVTFGVRPFPSTLYLQTNFTNGEKGYWIVSVEVNPFDTEFDLSFGSRALLTFGYRWRRSKHK